MEESQIKQIIEQQPLHGSALLDPRCKILLLVCIGFVSYFLAGEVVSLALMLVYGLFIAVGNGGKWALKMIAAYIIVAYLNALLRYVQVPVLSVIMSVFGVTLLKLIPIVMMGLWILRTTYMDDLMVALQRMRLPQAVTIPLVVMFRYIPTLRIEYRQIRSTMDIRGISDTLWKRVSHPLAVPEGHGRAGGLRHYPGAGAGVQTVRPAPHSFLLAGDPGVPAGHPFPGGAAGPGPDPNRGNHLVEGVT